MEIKGTAARVEKLLSEFGLANHNAVSAVRFIGPCTNTIALQL